MTPLTAVSGNVKIKALQLDYQETDIHQVQRRSQRMSLGLDPSSRSPSSFLLGGFSGRFGGYG